MIVFEMRLLNNALSRAVFFAQPAFNTFFIINNGYIAVHLYGFLRAGLNAFGTGNAAYLADIYNGLATVKT